MGMQKENGSRKKIIGVCLFVLLAAVLLLGYQVLKPKSQEGSKDVTLSVLASDQSETVYKLQTDAEFLIQVMDELKEQGFSYSGTEGEFGMMVDTVNNEVAVYEENSSYWAFFLNGEYANYGIAEQPVTDGDVFEIIYTTE